VADAANAATVTMEAAAEENDHAPDSAENVEAADLATALAMSAAAAVAEAAEAEEAAQAAEAAERQLEHSPGAETGHAALSASVVGAIEYDSDATGAAASSSVSDLSTQGFPSGGQHDAIVDVITSAANAPEGPSPVQVSESPLEETLPTEAAPNVPVETPVDALPVSATAATPELPADTSALAHGGVASRGEQADAPDEASLSAMMAMGLDRDWCVLALRRLRGDVESAVAFCFEHFEAMPRIVADAAQERRRMQERVQPRGLAGNYSDGAADDEFGQLLSDLDEGPLNEAALHEMIQMGIPREAAEIGLRATSNVLELAMQFVFDRGDEMAALISARRRAPETSAPSLPRPEIEAHAAAAASAATTTTTTTSNSDSGGGGGLSRQRQFILSFDELETPIISFSGKYSTE